MQAKRWAYTSIEDHRREGWWRPVVLVVVLVVGMAVHSHGRTKSVVDLNEEIKIVDGPENGRELELVTASEYETRHGPIGDGLYPFRVVEMHRMTTLRMNSNDDWDWTIDNQKFKGPSVQMRFTELGKHQIYVTNGREQKEFQVVAKYVRRELRDLTDEDRQGYLGALHQLYTTEQEAGTKMWGPDFKNAAWFVKTHLYGAAKRDCDHWHDDAGFITHHVGVTMLLERSLQAIDPTVASAYWDYTLDAQAGNLSIADSMLFQDDWFGSANPENPQHIIDQGRWAFTPVVYAAPHFDESSTAVESNITNPYGLLRSPWNTNSVPYLSRFNKVLGTIHAANMLPLCSQFQAVVSPGMSSIAEIFVQLNGELHGSVHIMLGGLWGFDLDVEARSEEYGAWRADQILLGSKFLWRQGYVDCPASCTDGHLTGEPRVECACTCGRRVQIFNGTEASAIRFLEETGIMDVLGADMVDIARQATGGSYATLVEALCHVGHPGELFTSAAPQDPVFWPLHGLAERFLQLVRLWNKAGTFHLDEAWGYQHAHGVLSDTRLVCDWTDVDDLELPECTKATCPGHRATDFLPFEWPVPRETPGTSQFYTNAEFYDLIAPWDDRLPYVYDRLASWPACRGGSLVPYDPNPSSTNPLPSPLGYSPM